jgi:transposase-like protein
MKQKQGNSHQSTSSPQKYRRYFSEELKRKKVKEIDIGLVSVAEVSRSLEVSFQSVYRWLHKYSLTYEKPIKLIMESKSETKKVEFLKAQIKELEQAVGQKQMKIDFLEKLIEVAGEDLNMDLKKSTKKGPSTGIGKKKKR